MFLSRRGFTMIEIVISIAIIAILLGISVPVVGGIMKEARISRAQADLDVIAKGILNLYQDTSFWPTDTSITTSVRWTHTANGLYDRPAAAQYPNWKGPYIEKTLDPSNVDISCMDAWGGVYVYSNPARSATPPLPPNSRHRRPLSLSSNGPDRVAGNADDIIYRF